MTSLVVPDWRAIVEIVVVFTEEEGNVTEDAGEILSEMVIVSAEAISPITLCGMNRFFSGLSLHTPTHY